MIRAITTLLLCIGVLGCASPGVKSPRREDATVAVEGARVPSEVYQIALVTPDLAWWISVKPDGSVNAQFGSSGGDVLRLPKGSVDFAGFRLSVIQHARAEKDRRHPVPVCLQRVGVTTHRPVYVNPQHLPGIMLRLEEQEWRGLFGRPVSERLIEIRRKHPLRLITERPDDPYKN